MFNKIIISSILSGSFMFAIGSADININSKTLQIGIEYNLDNSYKLDNNSNYLFTASHLRSESDESSNTKTLTSIGLKMINPYINDYGFSFGLGIKGALADNSDKTFVAVPLEFFVSYIVDERFHIDSEIAYAPKVLTFSDGDSYKEWNAKVNYKLLENGYLYLGTRGIKTFYSNDKDIAYDNNLFFGFKVHY